LVRFVLDPDGVVTPDLAAKLPGRGAWTRASREAITAAAAKGLFARAFKKRANLAPNATPDDLARFVERAIEQKVLSALGLARRAGKAHLGFDQAAGALREGKAAALLVASDASADVAAKLTRLAGAAPVMTAFDVKALSQAFGRENVTYAALKEGPETTRLLREARRLAGFRTVFAPAGAGQRELA
jgi:predicted RNA-binding protein YlxR (DUF448 family)